MSWRGAIFRIAALVAALLAGGGPAAAHTGGSTGYAHVTVQGQTVRYALTLVADALDHGGVSPDLSVRLRAGDFDVLADAVGRAVSIGADGRACAPVPGSVTPPSSGRPNVVIVVDYACPAAIRVLSLRDDLFDVLGSEHHRLGTIEWPQGRENVMFQPDRREVQLALAGTATEAGSAAHAGILGFFLIGIEHILFGFDHVLFVVALALGGGRLVSLFWIVTSFTVAHSITLALAVLDVVTVPARLVEAVIALSIAYVALENIFIRRAPSRRWAVSFLFGLVHGFGFAGALMEIGLPKDALVTSLVSFNLGVEAGQAMLIGVLAPALLWLNRLSWERRFVQGASAALVIVGVVLLVERTFG